MSATKTKSGPQNTDIKYLDVVDLLPNPYQPDSRVEVDPETAKRFALSFQEHGLIQTPVVRACNGRFQVADGWLRRAGFLYNLQQLGLKEYAKMPCLVRDLTDQQMADMVMEANTVRKDLNPIELAMFYRGDPDCGLLMRVFPEKRCYAYNRKKGGKSKGAGADEVEE